MTREAAGTGIDRERSRRHTALGLAALCLLLAPCPLLQAQSADPNAAPAQNAQPATDSTDDLPQSSNLCLDPLYATTPLCQARTARGTTAPGQNGLYVDSAGLNASRRAAQPAALPPEKPTDFQRLARISTGRLLPIYGADLFDTRQMQAQGTTDPAQNSRTEATGDYILGPGDQVLLRLAGPQSLNSQLTVDRAGNIYVPPIGSIQVGGLRYDQLEAKVRADLNRFYRNYELQVNLGQLRSIQVYVVGDARRPGSYTVGSFSTILNALVAAGGVSPQGSLRHIGLLRGGQRVTDLDLYAFLQKGDKAQDSRLEPGDVIVVSPVGPQVALSGSVEHPAIFELVPNDTLADLLRYAGGLSPVASNDPIRVERLGTDKLRHTFGAPLTAEGEALPLQNGDVLTVPHISPAFEATVTLRGNLANPGRFRFVPGMRLSDIIPDRMSLLTDDYWTRRNQLGQPVPLFEPLPNLPDTRTTGMAGSTTRTGTGAPPPVAMPRPGETQAFPEDQALTDSSGNPVATPSTNGSDSVQQLALNNQRVATGGVTSSTEAQTASPQDPNTPLPRGRNRISIPVPEIALSYAVIERLNKVTLKSELLPFNLGKLLDHDPAENLELQSGDVVTLLSQADIPVALDDQTKYVRLEGEIASAGVYSVRPGETLQDVVRRAGGTTSKAYLYGSSFYRESARRSQQERLDEYIAGYSLDLTRSAAVRAASSTSTVIDPNAATQQQSIVTQLKSLRSTGRIVLELAPDSMGVASIPPLPLENGDVFRIPPRPQTVNVIGAVYGQNVFLYRPGRHIADYIDLAGKPNRVADSKHAFVIRADGSVVSRELTRRVFSNSFDSSAIYPGDSIVVPEKLIKPSTVRTLLDYSQILASFGISAAAIRAIR